MSVDLATGAQTILAPMPQPERERLFCRKLSPDGSQLLFAIGESPYQPYLFDSLTGQSRETDIVPNQAFWGSDSQHILALDDTLPGSLSVHALPAMTVVSTAVLPLLAPGLENLSIVSTSPDGQWLVACSIDATDQQSWLYHMPTQTWQQLPAGRSDCVNVVGWPTR
ncbi:MAG: hypothetical protein HC914_12035 [Chloroflexaceae bacterium]|nr:hypothetical protein [Chloroflexaceae bacterium]